MFLSLIILGPESVKKINLNIFLALVLEEFEEL
jgi:hypothetical protein